ncbi:MAG: glycosyltransferase [Sulfurovaceae bacterium]
MKILLISNMYPSTSSPFYGIFVQNFENGIITKGGTVYKAVIEGRAKNKLEKVMKYLKFFYDVAKLVFTAKYDLIYVHYVGHSLLPLVPIRAFLKKPLVINVHGSDLFSTTKSGELIQKLVIPVIRKANLVAVPSRYFAEAVSEKFSIDKDKIFVSPSGGIDTSLFKPSTASQKNAFFTIGFVSRIDEGKGWDTLLLAAKELKNRITIPFKVIIIGSGTQESDLRMMIAELELQNEVEYLGPIPHHDLPVYYARFDLFAFPTHLLESLGLVGLEAMACGVPVVGSSTGGLKGYIISGYNGELFGPGNHLELAKKIERFMALNKNEQEAFRRNAIATAGKYDALLVGENLYNKLQTIAKIIKMEGL